MAGAVGSLFVENAQPLTEFPKPSHHLVLHQIERHGDDGQSDDQIEAAQHQLVLAFVCFRTEHVGAGH